MPDLFDEIRARYPSRAFEVDGARWTVRDTGPSKDNSPPLFLLPGAMGTGDVFYRLLADMAAERRLVAVTFPAIGDARRLASGFAGLLDAMGAPAIDLLGTSLGGYVAQWVALEHGQRLRKLILANTFHDPALQQARWPPAAEYARRDPGEILAVALKQLEEGAEPTAEHAVLKRIMLRLVGSEQDARAVKAMRLAVLTASPLGHVGLPDPAIALIDDDNDSVIAGPTREAIRQLYAGSLHIRIPGGSHYPANLQPAAYCAAIRTALQA